MGQCVGSTDFAHVGIFARAMGQCIGFTEITHAGNLSHGHLLCPSPTEMASPQPLVSVRKYFDEMVASLDTAEGMRAFLHHAFKQGIVPLSDTATKERLSDSTCLYLPRLKDECVHGYSDGKCDLGPWGDENWGNARQIVPGRMGSLAGCNA